MLERVWRKENPLALLGACLGIPRTEEPGGLQSMGSQTVGHNWSDLASLHYWWECKLIQPLWRTVWRFLKRSRNKTTIWPNNPTTGHIPWENRNSKRHMQPNVHRSAISTARIWKQPRRPSTHERIKSLWCTHTMEFYSAIKRNAFESVLMRWMNLEPILEWKKSEREKRILYINAYIWNLERPYVRAEDTDAKNRLLDSVGKGEHGMIWVNSTETYILPYKIDSHWEFDVRGRAPKVSALWQPEGMGWEGGGREMTGWRWLWRIANLSRYYKAIILQLK